MTSLTRWPPAAVALATAALAAIGCSSYLYLIYFSTTITTTTTILHDPSSSQPGHRSSFARCLPQVLSDPKSRPLEETYTTTIPLSRIKGLSSSSSSSSSTAAEAEKEPETQILARFNTGFFSGPAFFLEKWVISFFKLDLLSKGALLENIRLSSSSSSSSSSETRAEEGGRTEEEEEEEGGVLYVAAGESSSSSSSSSSSKSKFVKGVVSEAVIAALVQKPKEKEEEEEEEEGQDEIQTLHQSGSGLFSSLSSSLPLTTTTISTSKTSISKSNPAIIPSPGTLLLGNFLVLDSSSSSSSFSSPSLDSSHRDITSSSNSSRINPGNYHSTYHPHHHPFIEHVFLNIHPRIDIASSHRFQVELIIPAASSSSSKNKDPLVRITFSHVSCSPHTGGPIWGGGGGLVTRFHVLYSKFLFRDGVRAVLGG